MCCGKEFDDNGFTSTKYCGVACAIGSLFGNYLVHLSNAPPTQEQHSHNFKNLTGLKFGDLCVVEYAGKDKNRHAMWKCKCVCGKDIIVAGTSLKSGQKSCGCEGSRTTFGEQNTTHGESNTRLYSIWKGMKNRCLNPNVKRYKDYGGRGITVCEDWKSDYVAFATWAKEHGYSDDLSIDRIDVDGNYEPQNCRWIPMSEQSANRRPRTQWRQRSGR